MEVGIGCGEGAKTISGGGGAEVFRSGRVIVMKCMRVSYTKADRLAQKLMKFFRGGRMNLVPVECFITRCVKYAFLVSESRGYQLPFRYLLVLNIGYVI